MSQHSRSCDNTLLRRSLSPLRIEPRRLSKSSFMNRFSAAGKLSNQKTTVAVILDENEVGTISIKPSYLVTQVRKKVDQKMRGIATNYRFIYADETMVSLENESNTRIESCMPSPMMLKILTPSHITSHINSLDMNIYEDRLQNISSEAEAVVRCCFRIIENFGNMSTKVNTNSDIPNHSEIIVQFVKDVARATLDATGTSEVHWSLIEKNLRELEIIMISFSKRPKVALLWSFRTDQKLIKESIASIQQELYECPNVNRDHAVYFVRFKNMSPETINLLDIIAKLTIDSLLHPKQEVTRKKIAEFLNMSDSNVKAEIENEKGLALFGVSTESKVSFRDRSSLVQLVKNSESTDALAEEICLKDILAPLFEQQSRIIRHEALLFNEETRKWAVKAFDYWMQSPDSPHEAFMFASPPGGGKTTFVSYLAETRSDLVVGIHLCRHDDVRYRDAKIMLLSLTYQLTLQSPHYESRIRSLIIENNLTRKRLLGSKCSIAMIFNEFFENPLAEIPIPDTERYCLIIDGLDEASQGESGRNEILETIRDYFLRLPSWLLVALTTTPRLPILKQLRKFNAVMIEPQSIHNLEDLENHFISILQNYNYGCENDRVSQSHALASLAKGNFLHGFLIADKIEMYHRVDDNKLNEYLKLPFEALLERDLHQLPAKNVDLFWQVVKLSMVAVKPLDCVVIVGLTQCTAENLDSVLMQTHSFFHVIHKKVRFLHKLVKNFLLQKLSKCDTASAIPRPRKPRLRSYCGSSLKDILSGAHESVSEELAKCHRFFASCVLELLRDNGVGDGRYHLKNETTKEYLLKYGVHHLALAHMNNEARKMILDPGFLLARANDAAGIAECCELLSEGDHLLQLVGRAVTLSLDAIAGDSRQLIGQLVGRLMAAAAPGHGDPIGRKQVSKFIDELKNYDYGFQWWMPLAPTWDQAEQAFLKRLTGHEAAVQGVAWHPEGRLCASASWDHTICVFDTLTGNCIQTMTGHDNQVYAVDWDPSGTTIASGSLDCTIKIWNFETSEVETTFTGHLDAVFAVAFSKDGINLASGSKDKSIRIWSGETGDCIQTLLGHAGAVYCVSWRGGGDHTRLCSGGTDNTVRIWDVSTSECLSILTGHRDWVRSCHWCGNGKEILSGSADTTVRLWDIESRSCEQVFMGHSQGVWSVVMSLDGRYAFSGSTDGTVRVWDCNLGRCDQVLEGHSGYPVWAIDMAPDGKRVLSGSSDKSIVVWDATVGRSQTVIDGHSKVIWSVDGSQDGLTILTSSSDKTARLWNTFTGQCERVFSGHTGPVWTVKLSYDERKVATGSTDNTAAIYRIRTGERRVVFVGHTDSIWDLVWSRDDLKVFTASRDSTIRRWDTCTGICEFIYQGHKKDVKGLSLSHSGKRLASASTDGTIRIWNLETDKLDNVLQRKEAGALCVSWNPDDTHLVAGYTSGCVRVWNNDTGVRVVGFLPGHTGRTNAVDWSPNGTRIVSVSTDKEIRIWNVSSHACERIIKGSTGLGDFGVKWINNAIVSVGADQTIRIFDPNSGRCETAMARNTGLGVFDVSWSRDGKSVVTGSRDRRVQIWDAETGLCRKTLTGHTNWIYSVNWEKGGKRVMSKGDDRTTRVWDVDTGDCLEVVEDSGQNPDGFEVDLVEGCTVDLSKVAEEGCPVGVQCEKVRIYQGRACGWVGQSVYFFKLMGLAPTSDEVKAKDKDDADSLSI